MGEDLADVVAAGAEDREDGVSGGAFQGASAEAAIGFHRADFRLDGAAAAEIGDELWCQAAPHAADQDTGFGLAVTTVAAIDDCQFRAMISEDLTCSSASRSVWPS